MEVPDNNKKFKALNHFSHPLRPGGPRQGPSPFPEGHWEEGGNRSTSSQQLAGTQAGPRQEAGRVGVEKGWTVRGAPTAGEPRRRG